MTWWEIVSVIVVFWLYMTRMCIRWVIELESKSVPDACDVFLSLCLWWIAIPMFWTDRCKKLDRRLLSERRVRMIVGESGWHKRERLAAEHKTRTQALGMPES